MKKIVLTASIVFFFLTLTASAQQAQFCLPHDKMIETLNSKFQEVVRGKGLVAQGKAMVEMFISDEGSWTIVASTPNGQSCVIASGDSWRNIIIPQGDPV